MSESNSTIPEPRRVADELPNQAAVDAAGIQLDLETARLVACVIFRQATKGRAKSRMTIYNTILALAFMAREPLDRNGRRDPAPFPHLRLDRWPQGPSVFERLGITNRELEAYGIATRLCADDAVLPLDWALAFYPPAIWPMIAKVVEWGPERTGLRMERAVMTMARTPTQRDRRRRKAGEPLSLATIENRLDAVWHLMRVLVELRSIASSSPVLGLEPLEAWTTTPDRIDARVLGAKPANQDNTGPSVDACSERLKQLAYDALKTTHRNGYLKRRAALLMGILPLYGPRAGAFRAADVGDYVPQHRYPDGSRGPVLIIKPGKTLDPDELHFLPLPAELAGWVENWISFTGRHIGQANEPLFPGRKPKPSQPNARIGAHGFYSAIAGAHQAGGTGSHALLPLDDNPFIGYRIHAYRHTANQLISEAAARLQRANPGFFPQVAPAQFSKAVLGHELITDITAVYSDLDRQLMAKAVIDKAWQILWDDGILQRGPDPDRIHSARHRRDALALTHDCLIAEIRACEARAEQLTTRANHTRDKHRKLELKLDAATEQNTAYTHRDELRRIAADLAHAEAELDAAHTTLVPIPNDRTNEEHEQLVRAALGSGQPEQERTPDTGPLADEITVSDAAELWQTEPQTINRWYRNGCPAHRLLAWLGGKTAWHIYTAKDKRLRVDAINTATLTEDQQERLTQLRRRRAKLDTEADRPNVPMIAHHRPSTHETALSHDQTPSRQTADGLIDAWQTSGSSPPEPQLDDPRGHV